MLNTVEAVLKPGGMLEFLEKLSSPITSPRRVLVTFTEPEEEIVSMAALSERSLAVDWQDDAEDAAWAHLQPAK